MSSCTGGSGQSWCGGLAGLEACVRLATQCLKNCLFPLFWPPCGTSGLLAVEPTMQPVSSTETSQTLVLLPLFRSCKTPVRVFRPAVPGLSMNSRNSLSETFMRQLMEITVLSFTAGTP